MAYDPSLPYGERWLTDPNLIFNIRGADASGTAATDNSGNGFNGLYTGSPTLGSADGIGDGLTAVEQVNATGQTLTMTGATGLEAAINGQEFTWRGWFYGSTAGAAENLSLLRIGNVAAAGVFHVNLRYTQSNGTLFWLLNINNSAFVATITGATWDFNGWHRYALVVSNTEDRITMWLDNTKGLEQNGLQAYPTFDWGDRFIIAARSTTQEEWPGRYAHQILFDRALSDAEMDADFIIPPVSATPAADNIIGSDDFPVRSNSPLIGRYFPIRTGNKVG